MTFLSTSRTIHPFGMQREIITFLDHLRLTQRSPLTIRRYGDVLREIFCPRRQHRPRRHRHRGASTVRLSCSTGWVEPDARWCQLARGGAVGRNSFFGFLRHSGAVAHDPAASLVGVREPHRVPKYLSTTEVTRLVVHLANRHSADRQHDVAIVIVLWQTALRVWNSLAWRGAS